MSVFDTVRMNGKTYQTKDLDGAIFGHYDIVDSVLKFQRCEYNWVDEPDDLFGGYIEETFLEYLSMDHLTRTIELYTRDESLFVSICKGKVTKIYDNSDGHYSDLNEYLTDLMYEKEGQ